MERNNEPRRTRFWAAGLLALLVTLAAISSNAADTSQDTAPTGQQVRSKTVTIAIEGMSCVACAARVKKALVAIDGVSDVEVSLADRYARVRYAASKLAPDRLVTAINELGYRASAPTEVK